MKPAPSFLLTCHLLTAFSAAHAQESERWKFTWENLNRLEVRENTFDFDDSIDSVNDDAFLLNRFRIGILAQPSDWLQFFVQGQDSRELGSKRPDIPGQLGAEGDDPFDLRQCYVQVGDPSSSYSLKAGRQVLLYGDQRLIGPLEWSALSRTFDAVKLHWAGENSMWVDAFVSSVVVAEDGDFNESSEDSIFSGVYGHMNLTARDESEAYLLHKYDQERDEDFFTVGTRFKSLPKAYGNWDYEAEIVYQQGDAKSLDLQAYAIYGEVGYTFSHSKATPRISLEYSFGSGDDDATDGNLGSFQNLYPTNHLHYGFMDAFSWSNVHDVCLHTSIKPTPQWMFGADLHAFWLADTADSWKRANNTTAVRPIDASADSFAGMELDLLCSYKINDSVNITLSYIHFFAGEYLDDTGAGDDADFGFLATQWTF